MCIQTLGPELAVEAFDEGIVGRLARAGDVQDHALLISPEVKISGDELTALIDPDGLGIGLQRKGWSTTGPIREIFQNAFTKAGLPYFHPHSFRDTLTLHGQQVCDTPETFKAWSQNLGHESVLTTFMNDGGLTESRQGELIRNLGLPKALKGYNLEAMARDIAHIKEKMSV